MARTHRSLALQGAAALALAAGGCEKFGNRGAVEGQRVDVAAIKQAIVADERRWNEEYHTKPKSAERLMAHYASDANIVPSGLNQISGALSIRNLFGALAADPNFDMTLATERIEVAGSGDLAYTRGRYSDQYTDPSTKQVRFERGTFVLIYKKQKDGSWKIIEDISAPDTMAERPPM